MRSKRKIFRLHLNLFFGGVALSAETEITVNEGKYLKFIYRKQLEEFGRVRTTVMARSVGVRPATVTEMLQKLAEKGLLRYTRYRGVRLTKKGIVEARKLLRKHRLLEFLFVRSLNYDVQRACDEASNLDHYASEDLVNTICRTYGHPESCPCNKVIFSDERCKEKT